MLLLSHLHATPAGLLPVAAAARADGEKAAAGTDAATRATAHAARRMRG